MKKLLCLCVLLLFAQPTSAQTVSADRFRLNTGPCIERSGSGSPEGVLTGSVCDTYHQTDSPYDIWRKVSGTASTTLWVKVTAGLSAGGTVTSVGITGPTGISWANSPVTTSGTLTGSLTAGYFLPNGGSAGQILTSAGASAPAWTTATYPSTATVNQIVFATGANAYGSNAALTWNAQTLELQHATAPYVRLNKTNATAQLWDLNGGDNFAVTDATAGSTAALTFTKGTVAALFGGAVTLPGLLTANGGITADGGVFTVADTTGLLTVNGGITADGGVFTVADTTGDVTSSGFIGATTFASQTTGWRATAAGSLDVRYLYTDELRAKLFTADLESVLAGSQRITKSFSTISQAFTCPAASGTSTLWVFDSPTFGDAAVFVSGDAVIIHNMTRTVFGPFTISDCVGVVTVYADGSGANAGQQSWTFTRNAGGDAGTMAGSTVVAVNQLVQDMGVTGNGYIESTAVDGAASVNAPYTQIVTWATAPVAANLTARCRLGNLLGITTTAEYGLFCGSYSGNAFVRFSDQNAEIRGIPFKLYDGATNTVLIDPAAPSLAMGNPLPTAYGTGTGIWMGKDTAYKFRVGNPSGNRVAWDGTNLTLVSATVSINEAGISLTPGTSGINSYKFTVADGLLSMMGEDLGASGRYLQLQSLWTGAANNPSFINLAVQGGASGVDTASIAIESIDDGTVYLSSVKVIHQGVEPSWVMLNNTTSARHFQVRATGNFLHMTEWGGTFGELMSLDLANKRVGIATGSPGYIFHSVGNALITGPVYIGALGDTAVKLNVVGTDGTTSDIALRLAGTTGSTGAGIQFTDASTYNTFAGTDGTGAFKIITGRSPGTAGTNRVFVKYSDGYVGVGTIAPEALLHLSHSGSGVIERLESTDTGATTSAGFDWFFSDTSANRIQGAQLYVEKEQSWTTTASTRDSAFVISLIENNVLGNKFRMDSNAITHFGNHVIPGADNSFTLGTVATDRWKDIYAVTKTSVLDTSWGSGRQLVTVLEGPEYLLYDSGTVTLNAAGRATVTLDPHFVEVTNTTVPYRVLTGGATVRAKTAASFQLEGPAGAEVDWMVAATRAGFENVRWRDPTLETQEPLGLYDPWNARNLKDVANNTQKERARRNPATLPNADKRLR